MGLVRAHMHGEAGGGILRQLGRLAVHDDQHDVPQLREGGLHRLFALAPVDVGRDQCGGVGRYGEPADIDQQRQHGDQHADPEDQPGAANTGGNERGNRLLKRQRGPLGTFESRK